MHQQIRTRLRTRRGTEAGSLQQLLELLRDRFNLSVAGYSSIDADQFVLAVDHETDPDATAACHALIVEAFDSDAELVDLAEGRDWKELPNVQGALLDALTSMEALDAAEVLIGAQGGTFFVQVRKR